MLSGENPWLSPSGLAAVLNPSSSTPGGPPPKPPVPPDPLAIAFGDFPPLSSSPTKPSASITIHPTVHSQITFASTTLPAKDLISTTADQPNGSDVTMEDSVDLTQTTSRSEIDTVAQAIEPSFTILPPKPSSPIITNRASGLPRNPTTSSRFSPSITLNPTLPAPTIPAETLPSATTPSSSENFIPPSNPPHPSNRNKNSNPPKSLPNNSQSYAAKAKLLSDRSLKRVAPTTISPGGKPRVHVPDAVFESGAALHKEYVVGSFLGKMPDYGPIQSVLNYMWGKGSKLEIHLQPLKHSMLVRVPNDFIRSKILEKKLWYVDTSMFYVSQWGSNTTESYPEITSIPLWAHLRGIPFDLRTKVGLSHAAGLVGEPIETDDYTKNVSSLNIAHVKVEADLTKLLPYEGELVRENGEIITIGIDYPWVPPSCTHCRRIGHITKNCIYPPAKDQTPTAENDGSTPPVPIPSINLQGFSPNVMMEPPAVVAAVSDQSEAIEESAVVSLPPVLESDSQAAVDYITDSLLPLSESVLPPPTTLVTNVLEISPPQPFIFSSLPSFPITSTPPLLPVHTLSSSTPPPSPPSSSALLSPTTVSFASDPALASVVVSLAAVRAPLSNSYIAKKQASLFNSPLISLPPAFFDKSSASWKASTTQIKSPSIPPPSFVISNPFSSLATINPEDSILDGTPPQPSL
ncbi:mucin-2-like [Brassica napus]|uniref:mucin-2-like n=1 Tax=Brassica napus TaxID=3708 RepID=UPI00207886F9|nr:mucin-2-like [Brassica napus]